MNFTNSTNSSVLNAISYNLYLAPRSVVEVIFESMSVIIIISLALFGNIVIFGVLHKEGVMHKSSNLLIFNLAMTDVMSSVLSLPLVLVTIATGKWIIGSVMCQFQAYISYVLYSCTLCTLTVVSVNRYTLLSKPHFHRRIFGRRNTVAIVIGIWVTSFIFGSPPLIGWSRYVFLSDYAICVTDPIASSSFNMFLFVFLLINMSIIIISYTKIFATLRNLKKINPLGPNVVANQKTNSTEANRMPGAPQDANQMGELGVNQERENPSSQTNQNQGTKPKEMEITSIIFLIICLFGFCYLPTFIVGFFVFSSSPITRSMRLFSTFSISLTSVVNPFVFSIKSKVYRKLVKQVFRGVTGCFRH